MITLSNNHNINESAATKPIKEGFGDFVDDVKDAATDFATRSKSDGGLGVDKDDWDQSELPDKILQASDATGTLSGILDDKLRNVEKDNKVDGRSIIARATNSVKQCPIYVTRTIRASEAHLIAKLFEKVYVSFFQAVLAQNPIITPEEANDLNFLKQYHTDIRESAKKLINEYYEPIDDFDAMMQESIYHEQKLSDRCTVQFSVIPSEHCEKILAENARLMNEPLTGIPYLYQEVQQVMDPLYRQNTNEDETTTTQNNPEKISNTTNIVTLTDKDLEQMAIDRIAINDKTRDTLKYINMKPQDIDAVVRNKYPDIHKPSTKDDDVLDYYDDEARVNDANRKHYREEIEDRIRDAHRYIDRQVKELKKDIRSGKLDNQENGFIKYNNKSDTYYRKDITSKKDLATTNTNNTTKRTTVTQPMVNTVPELLRQTDIKKINGMDPYMMKANFIIRDPETRSNTEVSYIIGIKTVMHLIYVQDLADELYELVTGNIKSLQKVRYKTGEINWANYMFNVKGLKADAAKNINYNKRWIATLKQLANYNKTRGSLLKKPLEFISGTTPVPNATLILSQSDVTWLVNKTGIDLSQISNARRLAKSLFLIAIAIVDPSEGSMRVFFPDRDSDWDVQSLASIDAEVAKTDNSALMKELQRAVNNR